MRMLINIFSEGFELLLHFGGVLAIVLALYMRLLQKNVEGSGRVFRFALKWLGMLIVSLGFVLVLFFALPGIDIPTYLPVVTFLIYQYFRYWKRSELLPSMRKKHMLRHLVISMVLVFSVGAAERVYGSVSGTAREVVVYGNYVDLGDPVFSYESSRSFHGDGASAHVYKISDSFVEKWLVDLERRKAYPKNRYGMNWFVQTWSEKPDKVNLEQSLSWIRLDEDQDVKALEVYLEAALKLAGKGSYFAMVYRSYDPPPHDGASFADANSYIIDTVNKVLIELNHNS